ncbi:AMP-dependent synthetase/ligase [Pedobacter heparinus]|uniref:AMP-dependent synthetase and ligase n=1 Tax=Pedobacter heparinus (strain ATCC 13125 / DSM 2366 / CIP 104194 / JCM 7457 / NBRC 12017 / NCIMB 9290 / NRRL B-14731 / HIM 762-3) TaxID=485917 RepID=C6XTY7_PEDHD|nr:long-chain fatty acid--CoA ligase [Pedobacter heparinus]ACU03773.1 AMP-dependent synthetase and ligase [Pedobacter heparinus DSM 2366]
MELFNEHSTIPNLLRNVVANIHNPEETFLIHKRNGVWEEVSYGHTLNCADAVAAFFMEKGIVKGDRMGLMIENSPEYVYYDQGIQQIGAINVSIYPTLSEQEVAYIVNDSGMRAILIGNTFLYKKILKIAANCRNLEYIVPAFTEYQKVSIPEELKVQIIPFDEVLAETGKLKPARLTEIGRIRNTILPADISSLIYTSGTTGTPKGVMLSHSNFVENVKVCLQQIPVIDETETFLSFLPLSHVFERTATYHVCCAQGCRIAYAQSLELLAKNMAEIKPTVMSCVPRLLEKIHDKALKSGTAGGGLKSKIFLWALEVGQDYRKIKEAGKTPGMVMRAKKTLAEKLVFSKIKEKTGGRLKFMISGGAALPKNVGEFFGNLGIKILEGFGLTETSPVMAVTEYHRQVYGTVGRIIPGIEVGIQDIETRQMISIQTHDTFMEDFECAEGEIIVRGHCVMQGYFNKPAETAEVIDKDNWFHTGDIGRFYRGNLQITDRLKNMIVNAYGKNVYPTPVENIYLKSLKIDQIFLIGDKREYLTAIVIPNKENLQENFNLPESFFEKPEIFIAEKEITDWIGQDLKKLSNELAKFERIKNFKVKRNPFSIEEGEITPTLKAKRRVIEAKYAETINEMYAEAVDTD